MLFFASRFSTVMAGLLIFSDLPYAEGSSSLKVNHKKEDSQMPVARDEVPVQNRWNVEALYPNPDQWRLDLQQVKKGEGSPRWPQIASFKGKLNNPQTVASFFEQYLEIQRKLEKLHTYAHLRLDEDLGNDVFKSDFGLISNLIHEFSQETSWVDPELLSLEDAQFQSLIAAAEVKPYRFYLEKMGKMRPHTLTFDQEQLLALSGKALDTSYKAFGALNNADMSFKPAIDSKGQEMPLSNGSYLSYMRSPDRALRKSSFENLHRAFEAHANTICELLQGQVQSHLFVAKARHFDSCLSAALFPHQIDKAVYENLIASVRKRLPLLHEYIALRKKLLKLSDIHVYDLYVPLVEDAESTMTYSEARDAVISSVAPLGEKYQSILKKGLMEDRWVDVYENQRKRSGAYSSGCYDSMPYILMNYHGTLNDVLTLAHEAGHSMHSFLSRTSQPYIYSRYPIFVAEVASTFNEQLLLKQLKDKVKSKKDEAFLINYQIEGIRATIFRQTMFAEFELQLHKWAEEGVTFTPALLREYYAKLNREYYGPDLVIDPELEMEWARIPHFYYNFYVYQYATGLSAALALFQQAMKDDTAKERYIEFLSSGGSKYPIDLLKTAGVDMTEPHAVNAAMDYFGQLLIDLKKCF
jgi:oligoendopeptidase F